MKLTIRTAQMRFHSSYGDSLDITVKSGDLTFAPTWDIVMAHKRGDINDDEYTLHYYDLMRESLCCSMTRWRQLVESGSVTLLCFCPAGTFCHRYLLVDMLQKCCEHWDIDFEYAGEVS